MKRKPNLAVDVIIEKDGEILLIKRGSKTFHGKLALPGGHVEYGETVEDAAKREVKEETGLNIEIKKLFNVYSDPKRDPRGHVVSIVFVGEIKSGKTKASSDAADVKFYKIEDIMNRKNDLAFDHYKIIMDYLTKKDLNQKDVK
ncbi:MAG: NUDIX hydrolase [Candidatus Aenigmarchaeota archaeon]|nr:NUDIX hydrolase [Candidatus Aenigmarchaeota archaeon]